MILVTPDNNNRWVYTMHGLEKPMDHISAGGVMAGSVATLAVLWISLQTMGFLGQTGSITASKIPISIQTYLATYTGLPSTDYRHELVIDTAGFNKRRLPHIHEKALNASVNFAQTLVNRMSRLEANIANAGIGFSEKSPSYGQYVHSYPSDDALEYGTDAVIAMTASSYLAQHHCQRFGISNDECARLVSTLKLHGTPLGPSCLADQFADCNADAKYRSIDGSCNNLENPRLGSALTAYTRVLFPQYSDGIKELRRAERKRKLLPSGRAVSLSLSVAHDVIDISKTLAVMQWSEFIAHDLAHTPMRKMLSNREPISCCHENGGMLSPRHIHPDCAPISIAEDDPVYGKHSVRCMNYVRSMPIIRPDCTFGPAEQINQVSHFLDGSTVYGSTLKKSRELRSFQGGRLRVDIRNGNTYLPTADSEPSSLCHSKEGCYMAGDARVNAQPQLAVMHTIWHREHNRVARKLAQINPLWNDEILYQEARRIVVAEIQHITYREWLPVLLGRSYARNAGLSTGKSYSRNYNSYDDPAVSNEVATAALRFFNSLKQGKLSMPDETRQFNNSLQLSDYFYNPRIIESDDVFDGLLRGLATQTCQKMDTNLISDITYKLYKTDGEWGLDTISLDIQRGRDHGLPGYNHYRKYCGLPEAKTFDDFLDYIPLEMVRKLRTLYNHPNDIDLVIGGMAERSEDDGILGPTLQCLLTEQFVRTRRSDRFFYDSVTQPHPFTPEQLAELRNVTLARLFCDNGDNIARMQPNAFMKPQLGNELTSCHNVEAIPSVDLFAWAEKAKAYR
ncbi:peroxidase isoform X3 [Cephus cinctus]|uniref:Peroxidase isoform X3 n=1 Tax=Cephus cinctus TaxID=211228 RepID=A0AAJ7FNK7_CEPCN|nr:peroxidase isoform X3 [Cephus cinctus]